MPGDQPVVTEIVSEQTKIIQQESKQGRWRGKKKKRAAAQSDSNAVPHLFQYSLIPKRAFREEGYYNNHFRIKSYHLVYIL